MASHRYRIGERLRLTATHLTQSQGGTYEVLALMPQERSDGYQYRLKSVVGNQQRVALEEQLSRID